MPGGAHGEPWTPPVHRPILASAVDGSTRLGRGWRPAARRRQAPPVESAETRAEALQNPRNQQPAEKKRARVARASPRSAPGAGAVSADVLLRELCGAQPIQCHFFWIPTIHLVGKSNKISPKRLFASFAENVT
eukprot:gene11088-biopygen4827